GLRINPTRPYDSKTYYCTHFPIGTCLSSSWNTDLVTEVGKAIGDEVLEYGADVLLAPGVCLHRNPLCGRNFEYYSEDPVLSGNIAAAYINGVQSNGVGTSIKHFAFNNQETARLGNEVNVSQRAARELYLKNFEIAIKKSHPWTVMSSYNLVNGTMASENHDLLTTILRDEWGYKGLVMTDWMAGSDPIRRDGGTDRIANMKAGNDLIEPGQSVDTKTIEDAVKSGKLDVSVLNRNVRRILELIVKTPRFKGYQYSDAPDLKAHAIVTRNSAAEGTVLLENKGALPLAANVKNVALYGVASYDAIAGGTGSGNVNSSYTVSLVEGMRNNGYTVDDSILNRYTTYIAAAKAEIAKTPHEWFETLPLPKETVPTDDQLRQAVADNDIAVITLERLSGEGSDRTAADFNLSSEEKELVNKVTEAFHQAGKKAVVVLNIGGVIESASWKNIPDAILLPWQCGQEFGNSVAEILAGKLSPSGKLPMTWPVSFNDVPSSQNFPSNGLVVNSFAGGQAKYKNVKNVGYTDYDEGIYVGYRYFDTFNKKVSYPFGYGLSYTTFGYSKPTVANDGKNVTVSVTITNTGNMAGKEVAEVYVTAPKGAVEKPAEELKAFAKTRTLEPGESQTLSMSIDKIDLASFNTKASAWIADAGNYVFKVGSSSLDIKGTATLKIGKEVEKVHNVLKPIVKLSELSHK
ncbi:MAG TPA: glycosyl hydrolase, partial [Prevotella sp.]|nr:glycosyl hydrolase [Prevotella sp.]